MKTSVDWLNCYLDRPVEMDQAKAVLTQLGLPDDETLSVDLPDGRQVPCVDFEVTSNRGDALSHIGLARELAAGTDRTFVPPEQADVEAICQTPPVHELTQVTNEDQSLCPVYTARVITGVNVGPSPDWLIERLASIGLRPVNNVVDLTNFVLHETGQPLHAFDLGKLEGRQVVVRQANDGEAFTAIDGSTHSLSPNMLVIADQSRAQAVAGVMGGQASEVTEQTTDILLESAVFDPLSVRSTSRALKLTSDSSYRFERRVDPIGIDRASRRASSLIVDLAQGTLAQGVIRVGQPEPKPWTLSMRVERCNALLGLSLSGQNQAALLDRLGLEPSLEPEIAGQSQRISVTVPSYRLDLQREVDLIEEVARLHGLAQVPVDEKIAIELRPTQPRVRARQTIDQVLIGLGYHETITPTFLAKSQATPFLSGAAKAVLTTDDRNRAAPMLRPSVIPSLLGVRKLNQDMGSGPLKLYEKAACWEQGEDGPTGSKRVRETPRVTLLRDAEDASTALRELRAVIDELVNHLAGHGKAKQLRIEPTDQPNFTDAATLMLDNASAEHHGANDQANDQAPLAWFGLIDQPTLKRFDVQSPQAAATVDLDALIELYPPARIAPRLPRLPGIERDLSIIVDETIIWRDVENLLTDHAPAWLEALAFMTTYRGKPIDSGKKSLSFRLSFRDPSQTLTHEQVDPWIDELVGLLNQRLGAQLRSAKR